VRVLLDTNVLASALGSRGICAEIVEIVIREHVLLICEPVQRELERTLLQKFSLPPQVVSGFLGLLESEGELVSAGSTRPITFKDADDVPILACVVGGNADVFVTGDKALLELGKIEAVSILSPRSFWQRLAGLEER
jgi:uncharacterized protein